VRPGAVRLGTSASSSGISFSAFKNTDGSIAVQALNLGSTATEISISIPNYSATSAKGYLSDNSNTIIGQSVTLSDGVASVEVPGYAMMTVVLDN
jgi:hypothetical protein